MTIELTASDEFHGLRSRPFSLTPDLRFTYHSRSHTHALEQIANALKRREGLVVVTGEVGTGKTMLCRALLETFETRTFQSVILDPLLTVEDLLHQVLTDFGLMSARDNGAPPTPLTEVARHDLVATLQKFLSSLVPLNAHAVIMIDEAQHLTGPVLEQVRLLSNFETDEAKLLQIVLVGQPNLDILLQRADMRQLNQRVARRCELEPLTDAEVRDYVERRLAVASEDTEASRVAGDGSAERSSVTFTPAALQLVATISRGIPRLVNTICDRALEVAFDKRQHVIDRKTILLSAEKLRLPVPAAGRYPGPARAAVAAALVVLAAGGGWWWWAGRIPGPAPGSTPPATSPTEAVSTPPRPSANQPATTTAPATAAPASATVAPPPAPNAAPPVSVAPTTATPPPAGQATAAAGSYEISAATFKTEERAAGVARTLARSGLPVTSRIDSSGQWYRVVVGPFATAEQARVAQQTLGELGFEGTRVYRNE